MPVNPFHDWNAVPCSAVVLAAQSSSIGAPVMDKNRVKGSATNVSGKVKEGAGKLTGDQKLKKEGVVDQVKGKVQNAVGGIKDALKGK
jgi:uncharacterized protein YjbJ (UPF0337 family)